LPRCDAPPPELGFFGGDSGAPRALLVNFWHLRASSGSCKECLEVVAHARELAGASEESATCCMIFTEGRGL
jgi:hypothetical protein